MSKSMTLLCASALLACHVQYRHSANAGPAAGPAAGQTGAGQPGDGGPRTSDSDPKWGPMEPGGLTLGQLSGNYNFVMNHAAPPGQRVAAAKECIRFAGHARELGAAASMQLDLTHTVGANAEAKPRPGAPAMVTIGKAEADCRAAIAPAEQEMAASKAAEEAAEKARDEKDFAPYRKALTADKLATFSNLWRDHGKATATVIVDRDCVRFASPQAMARARSWFITTTDSVETVRRDFYENVWTVEKIEWKGDKVGRDIPNLHSGKGSYPPAAACR